MASPNKKTQLIKDAIENLLPHLQSLQDNYKEFLAAEKEKINKSVENLNKLLELEFSDNTGEDAAALEILKTVYGRDSDVVEEETS